MTVQARRNGVPIAVAGAVQNTKYREVRGRVCAYEEVPLAAEGRLPVAQVVLGYSSPMDPDDGGLAMLVSECGRAVAVERSAVQVR